MEILSFALPAMFQFLNVGWWIVHLIAIPVVFTLGYVAGQRSGKKPSAGQG